MRFILGFLSGILGLFAGWFGLAMLLIGLSGHDQDGGIAMGAFFNIGPIGGIAGFIAGVLLFNWFGIVHKSAAPTGTEQAAAAAPPAQRSISRPFAIAILAIAGGLAWYELIRSPYLSHGFMPLEMQFRLPAGMALPAGPEDAHIRVQEGGQYTEGLPGAAWHGHDGDRQVILARALLSLKTGRRAVSFAMPGVPEETWQLDLSSDPDPMEGYSPWRLSSRASTSKIEMNFRLSAER